MYCDLSNRREGAHVAAIRRVFESTVSESTASANRMERFVRPTTFERLLLILLYGYDGLKFFCHRSGGSYSVPIGTIVMYSTAV